MHAISLVTVHLLLASHATAQAFNQTYAVGLLNALKGSGLTALATLAERAVAVPAGQQLVTALSQGQKTLFAPNNGALAKVPQSIASNLGALAPILYYHVANGMFMASNFAQAPAHTVVRTSLNDSAYVNLEGGMAQVIVATSTGGKVQILEPMTMVNVTNTTMYESLTIHTIDSVLMPPGNVTNLLEMAGLSSLATAATGAGLVGPIGMAHGITIFAPTNAAFEAVASVVQTLNPTQVATVLANHVINGTSVYSTLLSSGKYTSAAGQDFTFMTNSSGTFVMSGMSTAKIIQSDILIQNGVVHLIDGVLANTDANAAAAQSAYNSATSAAGSGAQQTGAVGTTATATGANGQATNGAIANAKLTGWGVSAALALGIVALL